MTIAMGNIPAILALLVGILILIVPRFLNYFVAIYLYKHSIICFLWSLTRYDKY